MKAVPLLLALTAAGAIAHAQGSPEAHSDAGAQQGLEHQIQQMQDMHRRMLSARTPRERAALMDEQMHLMQSGMDMMDHMRAPSGAAMMGGESAGPQQQGGMPAGMGAMMGMMDMHARMEQRMAMMQMMMQMMVDRQAAMPMK